MTAVIDSSGEAVSIDGESPTWEIGNCPANGRSGWADELDGQPQSNGSARRQ